MLQADISSRDSALEGLQSDVQKLLISSPSAANADISGKLGNLVTRYDIAQTKCRNWGDRIDSTTKDLEEFHNDCRSLSEWLISSAEELNSQDPDTDFNSWEAKLMECKEEMVQKQKLMNEIKGKGQNLLNRPEVTESSEIRDALTGLDRKWVELSDLLGTHERDLSVKKTQFNAYEQQRDRVVEWMEEREKKIQHLPPAALDSSILHSQLGELSPLIREHSVFKPEIEIVQKLGEALMKSLGTSLTDSRPSEKKRSRASGRAAGGKSPSLSAASSDIVALEEELSGIKGRYDMLGMKIGDRKEQLNSLLDRLEAYDMNRSDLSDWIADNRNAVNNLPLPLSKEEAGKKILELRKLAESIKERRAVYEGIRLEAQELIRLEPGREVPGLDGLREKQMRLDSEWDALQDDYKSAHQRLLDAKDFHGNAGQLRKWLTAKQKMMAVLGPVGADPHLIENQLEQLAVSPL